MSRTYSDREIESLVRERKTLPDDWKRRVKLWSKRQHTERKLDLTGDAESEFRLILRQNKFATLDFSAILAVRVPRSNRFFRLRRYNGKSHEHRNKIENVTFFDFHIHVATERYQELGMREDAYAEPTDRFCDLHDAFWCLVKDAHLDLPSGSQGYLFTGE